MRLLHTTKFTFNDFFDHETPPYAILSHRWSDDEVTFQDYEDGKNIASVGFVKIQNCCSLAMQNSFDWVWIDTCCIDQKSSAELSESINSMYRWYGQSAECYVYLSDVTWVASGTPWSDIDWERPTTEMNRAREQFRASKWFTRGWTLQELLAPRRIIFFDREWKLIGHLNKQDLTDTTIEREVAHVSGIEIGFLKSQPLDLACVAVRMSWASRRQTSRREDMAYCLLGIFDVNMPLLYGEGDKAFFRLQSEIIKQSNDESIFAWERSPSLDCSRSGANVAAKSGLLAPNAACFESSGNMRIFQSNRPAWALTNRGLALQVPVQTGVGPTRNLMLGCYCDDRNRTSGSDKSRSVTRQRIVIKLEPMRRDPTLQWVDLWIRKTNLRVTDDSCEPYHPTVVKSRFEQIYVEA